MRALYGERGVDVATLTYVTQLYILPSNLCKPVTKNNETLCSRTVHKLAVKAKASPDESTGNRGFW